ncbi:hypothetical protein C7M84_015767 [Penaeus vannamei]|uniref:Uncharacterized protein n=1 Tax=Penaeus vannamei TaxID=6689 RepID=A0A423SPX5_PENVA|nr:hypothetical protein C7M84_015767 [Penaeus vannamei]
MLCRQISYFTLCTKDLLWPSDSPWVDWDFRKGTGEGMCKHSWCYRCVGSHPGCGLYDFDWRYYWSYQCPDPYDKCVKVIEQKGAEELMVTRDCLSNLEGHRRDIPADRYEGCRTAAADPLLGHYIFPSIKEIDHKRFGLS